MFFTDLPRELKFQILVGSGNVNVAAEHVNARLVCSKWKEIIDIVLFCNKCNKLRLKHCNVCNGFNCLCLRSPCSFKSKKGDSCTEIICDSCEKLCEDEWGLCYVPECKNLLCPDHARTNMCQSCKNVWCNNCLVLCNGCKTTSGHQLCSRCCTIHENCDGSIDSDEELCQNCSQFTTFITPCALCGIEMCNMCHDGSCDDCFESMCSVCSLYCPNCNMFLCNTCDHSCNTSENE